jgi:tetratricopeptide (TPR) repeat protein
VPPSCSAGVDQRRIRCRWPRAGDWPWTCSRLSAAASDPLAFTDLTGVLRRRALARVETDSLQLHRLAQAILRTHPPSTTTNYPGGNTKSTVLRLLQAAVDADPWNNPETWPTWRALLSHVLAATDTGGDLHPDLNEVAWLLGRAAIYLQTRGEPRPARPLVERALQLRQQLLGDDHPETRVSANNLAVDLHALGEYEQARQLHDDTLTRKRRVLGDDHPETLASATNLAVDLHALGEYEQARQLEEWLRSQGGT